ncbi:HdeD family acid-resistance protein [Pseudoalteromonas mariniglutinosa]|uniref:HdeD family acid-resistance protein n=1 Tax=Pseudoalteromonas mariniglutinosa TaxID=206042 RepID=UPI00384DAAF2
MQITSSLVPHWSSLMLRGILAIVFGLLGWFAPQASLTVILFILACYFFIDGSLRIWLAFVSKKDNPLWWLLVLGGSLSILAAAVTILAPDITALLLLYYIAIWAVVIGIIEIILANKLRKELQNEWLLITSGALSISFGLYIAINPGAGIFTLMWLLASYAVLFGVLMVFFSFKLKNLKHSL